MRVVFDTNVLLSSTLWDGSVAQKLLFKIIKSDVKVFASDEIASEYEKVLKRDFGYSDEEILNIRKKIMVFLNLVLPNEKIEVVKDDPDDNKIIECAIASSSDYILTYDKHLLKLKSFEKIKIITPVEAFGLI